MSSSLFLACNSKIAWHHTPTSSSTVGGFKIAWCHTPTSSYTESGFKIAWCHTPTSSYTESGFKIAWHHTPTSSYTEGGFKIAWCHTPTSSYTEGGYKIAWHHTPTSSSTVGGSEPYLLTTVINKQMTTQKSKQQTLLKTTDICKTTPSETEASFRCHLLCHPVRKHIAPVLQLPRLHNAIANSN